MGSKTRLSSYCNKRGDDTVNLVSSRKTNARLARPMMECGAGDAPSDGRQCNDRERCVTNEPQRNLRIIPWWTR